MPLPSVIGKSAKRLSMEGVFWFPPDESECTVEKECAEGELEALGDAGAPGAKDPPETKPERVLDSWPEAFSSWSQELLLPRLWLAPLLFVSLQWTCFFLSGESLFGTLTGGVVESLRLARTGGPMHWHMFAASAMWALGAAQFCLKPLRHGRWAWAHRALGRAFLALWFLIVGPTSLYLSLFCGTGPLRAQVTMTAFAVTSLDTALFAYYFFWRGWLVARRRRNGTASFTLHRKAVTAGILFTMTILVQRPMQSVIIALRKVLLFAAHGLPTAWTGAQWAMQSVATTLLDHNVGLSVSTVAFGVSVLSVDGPRSRIVRATLSLDEDGAEELFGSKEPSLAEVLFWRLRLPVYLVLRAIVTQAWTTDPDSR